MPNVDGFEATRAIRAMERDTSLGGRETPIVAMTAFSMVRNQRRGGAYLTLPYLTLPYLTLPCLTLPCLALPYLTVPLL